MDDRALFDCAHAGTLAFARAFGRSDGATVHELSGVSATVVPHCPERSVVNSVGYEQASDLEAALADVAGLYEAAGIDAWTVWVPERDREAAELLERAGHRLDATPAAMGAPLTSVRPAGDEPGDWYRTDDISDLGPLNDRAYGYDGSFTRALRGLPTGVLDVYVARVDGRAACCLGALDRGDDRHITLVATLPEARGRGLATGLLAHATEDARSEGLETTSLIATKLGAPLYERLGYRVVGTIQMWERRRG